MNRALPLGENHVRHIIAEILGDYYEVGAGHLQPWGVAPIHQGRGDPWDARLDARAYCGDHHRVALRDRAACGEAGTDKGTTEVWLGSGCCIRKDGFLDPSPVIYVPSGASLDSRRGVVRVRHPELLDGRRDGSADDEFARFIRRI